MTRYGHTVNRIAIYDLDRTITRWPTYMLFLLHVARTHQPWRLILVPFVFVTIILYGVRVIDRARLKEWNQRLLLGERIMPADLRPIVAGFATDTLTNNICPGALAQIAADRGEGYRLVLATASYRFYAAAIGARLGFDDVIATDSVIDADGAVHAEIAGENCYGPAKLRMIAAWMAKQGFERVLCEIRVYSDHVSDAPVLEWADAPFAVNPHAKLKALAADRGWPVAEWR